MQIFILFQFSMKLMSENRKAPDGTLHLGASYLGIFCLPMSHKKDARLIRVKRLVILAGDTDRQKLT